MYDSYRTEARIKRGLRKMIWILVWSTVLFALIKEGAALALGTGFYIPSVREAVDFLFFNVNPFGGHLWYISAYIYVLMIAYALNRYRLWKPVFCLIPFLLVVDLAFGKYSLLLWGGEIPYIYLRNFLFVGLPYFALGAWIKARDIHYKYKYLVLGIGIFCLTSFIEYEFLHFLGKNPVRDHYLSTTGLSVCLFLLFLGMKQDKPNLLSEIGEKDSLYIYVFHPLFIYYFFPAVNKMFPHPLWISFYSYAAPLLAVTLTLVLVSMLKRARMLS